MDKNVLGKPIQLCSTNPLTGFNRTGYCKYDGEDHGQHFVCARVTQEFLNFTKSKGNDLITKTDYFPGLKHGDFWCLCAYRWLEAFYAGVAPPVFLEATNIETLKIIPLMYLFKHRI